MKFPPFTSRKKFCMITLLMINYLTMGGSDIRKSDLLHNPELPVELFLNLFKTNHSMVKGLEEQLRPFGLTLGRLCLLVILKRFGKPMLPSELSDDLAVTRANVSGLLNALEKAGLVKRSFHHENRRHILVQMTEAGDRLLQKVWPVYVRTISGRVRSRLNDEEQEQLNHLLRKLMQP